MTESPEETVAVTTVELPPEVPAETKAVPAAVVPEHRGIKESQEILKAMGNVADLVSNILADGLVNWSDLQHVLNELKSADVYLAAVKGAGDVDDELKDLDDTELVVLGLAAIKLIKKFVDAAKKNKNA